MEEWKEYKIEETSIEMIDGDRGKNYPKNDEFFTEGYCLFLNAGNVTKNGFSFSENSFITREKDDALRKGRLDRYDVVITTRGTVGNVALYDMNVPFEHVRINSGMLILKSGKDIMPEYLYYYLKGITFQTQISQYVSGSAQPQLPKGTLAKMSVSYPYNKDTQKRIIAILKSLDDKIEVNRRINENLEQQAQALFKCWLEGCQDEVSIGDLSLNITDYSKCNHDQVVLINSSDVTEGFFDHHILSPNKDLKGHFKKRFKKGDILYSQVRPRNRHWGYCTFDADNYLASTQLMVIRNKEELIPSILLYQYIIDDKVWMDFTLKTETRSGTFPQGNYEDLSSIRVPYSSDVDSISKELNSLYSMIYNNEQESRRLAELRDTLLPRLMSGELKVNDLENNEI